MTKESGKAVYDVEKEHTGPVFWPAPVAMSLQEYEESTQKEAIELLILLVEAEN
jgi:hypothetical protein